MEGALFRRIGLVLLGLVGLLVVVGVAAYFLVGRYDFASFAASRASAALGRKVSVAGLHVTPGRWLTVALDGVRVDNVPGGSQPAMLELGHVTAEVEALSLLHGPTNVRRVRVDKLALLLERAKDGTRNWRFGADKPAPPDPAAGRAKFPTMPEAVIHDSEIVFRTSSGHKLRTQIDDLALRAPKPDEPITLTGTGSYNAVPIRLEGKGGSLAAMRDGAKPFPVVLHMASGDTTLDFDGTMTDPLNADGADGAVALVAPTLKAVLAIAGAPSDQDAAVRLAGRLERKGDLWRLTGATGAINDSRITAATLRLMEGGHDQPDDIAFDIAFDQIDLDRLLGRINKGKQSDADMPLAIDRDAGGVLVAAALSARQVIYAGFRAADVRLDATLKPGVLDVKVLAFSYLGAQARASGHIEPAGDGGRITADVSVTGADAGQFGRALSFSALPLTGRLDAGMIASGEAATLNAAVRGARVSAVVSMTGGSIGRNVIELASTDLRRVFRKPTGNTPVSCLLGVLDMRAGIGTVKPLRIRAAEGTIAGSAQFDLYRRTFDMTIGSQSKSTGLFALDIPMRVSGSFGSPSIRPAKWSPEGRALLAAATDLAPLPPGLREAARRNACVAP